MSTINELTGLRFYAALHVVFFHMLYLSGNLINSMPHWIVSLTTYGDSAVSFFFILSGFILTHVYVDQNLQFKASFKKFMVARFSRIYPLYLLAFILDVPRGLIYFLNQDDRSVAVRKIGASIIAHLFMLQSWHPRITASWNPPAWSLSTEMFFYLLAPFLIPFVFKLRKTVLPILFLYLLPIVIFYFIQYFLNYSIEGHPSSLMLWRSLPLLRLTEFLIGVHLGKLHKKERVWLECLKSNSALVGLIFWLTLCLSLFFITGWVQLPRPIFASITLVPLFSLMIFIMATVKVPFSFLFNSKVIVLLGGASYALYIVHVPLLYYFSKITEWFALEYCGLYFLFYLIVCILVSIMLYAKIEIPAQVFIRAWLGKSAKH